MSTFRGVMKEFEDVRVDFFRPVPGLRPPLACFLSHVHSDHLAGLESFKSPFIYASIATRELLLRLERYPHRLDFATGVLESRKQQYKHLRNLIKPIPLETPTEIELEPGNIIQVTLFDANHCTGAVMFLFEGNGNAVLYTGDIRSEPWFVNNLSRNPLLIEYTSGAKTLDCIYLDTSNTRPIEFPTKAEGLRELIEKVKAYPDNTIFYLSAWTFGYEEVWLALSKALKSQVHVDKYKMIIYESLRDWNTKSTPPYAPEGPALIGYKCGNTFQKGCLTEKTNVRIHSCEKGMQCSEVSDKTVWIRPIVTRISGGGEIEEVGVGGGDGDLQRRPELEVESDAIIEQILTMVDDRMDVSDSDTTVADVREFLSSGFGSSRLISVEEAQAGETKKLSLSLPELIESLIRTVACRLGKSFVGAEERSKEIPKATTISIPEAKQPGMINSIPTTLPRKITFPYSRHSSYEELCDLVRTFKPKDVYPCTVDEDYWYENGISIAGLFGKECSGNSFRHDTEMAEYIYEKNLQNQISQQTRTTESSPESSPGRFRKRTNSYLDEIFHTAVEQTIITTWVSSKPTSVETSVLASKEVSILVATPSTLDRSTLLDNSKSPENLASSSHLSMRTDSTPTINSKSVSLAADRGVPRVAVSNMAPPALPEAQKPAQKPFVLRRNSKGQLRPFDSEGNEIQLQGISSGINPRTPSGVTTRDDDALTSTPPRPLAAESPGSESQGLRRKLVVDELEQHGSQAKRMRVTYNGPASSSPATTESQSQGLNSSQGQRNLLSDPTRLFADGSPSKSSKTLDGSTLVEGRFLDALKKGQNSAAGRPKSLFAEELSNLRERLVGSSTAVQVNHAAIIHSAPRDYSAGVKVTSRFEPTLRPLGNMNTEDSATLEIDVGNLFGTPRRYASSSRSKSRKSARNEEESDEEREDAASGFLPGSGGFVISSNGLFSSPSGKGRAAPTGPFPEKLEVAANLSSSSGRRVSINVCGPRSAGGRGQQNEEPVKDSTNAESRNSTSRNTSNAQEIPGDDGDSDPDDNEEDGDSDEHDEAVLGRPLTLSEKYQNWLKRQARRKEDFGVQYDPVDEVYRCGECLHELWTAGGVCEDCQPVENGRENFEYFECGSQHGDRSGQPANIAFDEYSDPISDADIIMEVRGDYLDCDSEAYDTQDEEGADFVESDEYEADFINDEVEEVSVASDSDNDMNWEFSSEVEEPDYKALYLALQQTQAATNKEVQDLRTSYTNLQNSYSTLYDKYQGFKEDYDIDDTEDENDAMAMLEDENEFDDDGAIIVSPEPEGRLEIAEVVLCSEDESESDEVEEEIIQQAAEQSQNSELGPERIGDRVRGFQAASVGEWHGIELVSTAGHGEVEVEL